MVRTYRLLTAAVALCAVSVTLLTAACGGSSNTTTGLRSTMTGAVTKGPVSGATVVAYAINNGSMGAVLATATTDSQGGFSMSLAGYSGSVMLVMTGGNYTDESAGTMMSMMAGTEMTAALPSVKAGIAVSGIQVTALTSMAQAMAAHMSGGMTEANIDTANTAVGGYFMVHDILHTMPMNPLVKGSGTGANQDEISYGMALAAMSRYAKDRGMSSSAYFVFAMMQDASDGVLDGEAGGVPIAMGGMMGSGNMMLSDAGSSGLATSMSEFCSSAMNQSGITAADMSTLMNQLDASNGQL